MTSPFKFSIRTLLLLIAALPLVFSQFISSKSDLKFKHISNVAVSPDGKQVAVCLLQSSLPAVDELTDRFEMKNEADQFERTICLLNTETLKVESIVHWDTVHRAEDVPPNFFFNSQTRLTYPNDHLFYIDGQQKKLICHNLKTGTRKTWAELPDGFISSFDSSIDGSLLVLQGENPDPLPEGERIGGKDTEFILKEDGSLEEITPEMLELKTFCIFSDLGVKEPEALVLTSEQLRAPPLSKGTRWIDLFDRDTNPFTLRTGIVLSRESDSSHEVVASNEGMIAFWDQQYLDASTKYATWADVLNERKGNALDLSTTRTKKSRVASLFPRRLIVDLEDNPHPKGWNRLVVPCKTTATSSVSLSRDGSQLAVTDVSGLRMFNLNDCLPVGNDHSEWLSEHWEKYHYIRVSPSRGTKVFGTEAVSAMDFVPGGRVIIVGDREGLVSKYRVSDGGLISQVTIPGRSRGVSLPLLVVMSGCWLVACFFSLRADRLRARRSSNGSSSDEFENAVQTFGQYSQT